MLRSITVCEGIGNSNNYLLGSTSYSQMFFSITIKCKGSTTGTGVNKEYTQNTNLTSVQHCWCRTEDKHTFNLVTMLKLFPGLHEESDMIMVEVIKYAHDL